MVYNAPALNYMLRIRSHLEDLNASLLKNLSSFFMRDQACKSQTPVSRKHIAGQIGLQLPRLLRTQKSKVRRKVDVQTTQLC
jgi:hypothetical protein